MKLSTLTELESISGKHKKRKLYRLLMLLFFVDKRPTEETVVPIYALSFSDVIDYINSDMLDLPVTSFPDSIDIFTRKRVLYFKLKYIEADTYTVY